MCNLYAKTDPIVYESRSRTLRIHGAVTSIRLENMVWDVLSELAAEEGMTTNHLIATLHDEMLGHLGEVSNFASFLRITSLRYLRLKRDGSAGHAAPTAVSSRLLRRVQ
ncbi:MAG: ribbon-helix-helix domain-containing protein [Betaproteobacteria bacterium]